MQIDGFENYLNNKCGMTLHVIDVSKTPLDNLPTVAHRYKIEMYYRILAQFILPVHLTRILYLDADIIIKKDISEFYRQDFEGKAYAVCPDASDKHDWFLDIKAKLGLPKEYVYFNSGVMLMNLTWLRENTDSGALVEHCISIKDKLTFPDQDVLNTFYQNNVKYCDPKRYNYQTNCVDSICRAEQRNLVILHYCEKTKPWMQDCITNTNKHYWWVRLRQGDVKEVLSVVFHTIKHSIKTKIISIKV